MDEQLKSNLTSSALWVRFVYMLFLAFFLYIALFVVVVVVIIQCVIMLLSGTHNLRVKRFGLSLTKYIQQDLLFLTFNSNEKPFPFTDWPTVDEEVELEEKEIEVVVVESEDESHQTTEIKSNDSLNK